MLAFEKTDYKWEVPASYVDAYWQSALKGFSPRARMLCRLGLCAAFMFQWAISQYTDDPIPRSFGQALAVSYLCSRVMVWAQVDLMAWLHRKTSRKFGQHVYFQQTGLFIENGGSKPILVSYKEIESYRVEEIAGFHVVRFHVQDRQRIQACLPEDAENRADALRELKTRLGPPVGAELAEQNGRS